MHLAHLGQILHRFLEFAQRRFGLALQAHHGEHDDREAQLGRLQIGVVAADDPHILQRAYAPQARRCGQPDAPRQFDICDAPFGLQFLQKLPIDLIQIGQRPPLSQQTFISAGARAIHERSALVNASHS